MEGITKSIAQLSGENEEFDPPTQTSAGQDQQPDNNLRLSDTEKQPLPPTSKQSSPAAHPLTPVVQLSKSKSSRRSSIQKKSHRTTPSEFVRRSSRLNRSKPEPSTAHERAIGSSATGTLHKSSATPTKKLGQGERIPRETGLPDGRSFYKMASRAARGPRNGGRGGAGLESGEEMVIWRECQQLTSKISENEARAAVLSQTIIDTEKAYKEKEKRGESTLHIFCEAQVL
jgi:hypothetical protein